MITFNPMEQIRWGIIGPGKIATSFASDLQLVKDAEIAAVASRNQKRSQDFANHFKVKHVFSSYDALFASDTVDVVYIATPHVFHKDLAIKAMNCGKHVLCEKPLGVNGLEVEDMIKAAKNNNVFLMEALWSRFNPTVRKVKELSDQGVLGEVTYINADFAFYALDRAKESRLLNLDLAGGTLLDIGIYPVFLAYLFLGKPNEIKAISNFNAYGTEIQTSILFQYPNAQATLNSAFTHNSRIGAEIAGTLGTVALAPRFHETQGYTLQSMQQSGSFQLPTVGRGYYHEILEVHECLGQQQIESKLWSHTDSLHLISLLDDIRNLTGIRFPFET
ncbi:MAG: Gfo/Idh/MocA family oxidoreductase [Bacteroidota bacterium]